MMSLLDQQQHTEENELTYKLALQQNEEAEKLRKVFFMEIVHIYAHYLHYFCHVFSFNLFWPV